MAEEKVRDIRGFEKAAAEAARFLLGSKSVLVIGHIDADGITASSIASVALRRAGIEHNVRFVKKLDDAELDRAKASPMERLWFVDLGSGMFSRLDPERSAVSDHHRPDDSHPRTRGQADLFSFAGYHVNPHLYGLDGSTEISGAGATYAVAKAMDPCNRDLAVLAVIGAVGDFQDSAEGRLTGYNRTILQDAVDAGLVRAEKDLRLFGRQTRPLHTLLQHSSDPPLLPYITRRRAGANPLGEDPVKQDEDKMACIDFVTECGVPVSEGGRLRYWSELSWEERQAVVSRLVDRMIDSGKGVAQVRKVIGEAYTLSEDLPGAPPGWFKGDDVKLRAIFDAKEFATLLNACGRHEKADLGRAVCQGDRAEAFREAIEQQDDHREKLKAAIELVKNGEGNRPTDVTGGGEGLSNIRYFHSGDRIEDTIVGIVAGMVLGSDARLADRPLIGFAQAMDGTCSVKVSARGTRDLVKRGLDLSIALRGAAESAGGTGGGHNIAAGATIPEGREDEFLLALDRIVGDQLSRAL